MHTAELYTSVSGGRPRPSVLWLIFPLLPQLHELHPISTIRKQPPQIHDRQFTVAGDGKVRLLELVAERHMGMIGSVAEDERQTGKQSGGHHMKRHQRRRIQQLQCSS